MRHYCFALIVSTLLFPHISQAQEQPDNLRIRVPFPLNGSKLSMPVIPGTSVGESTASILSRPALAPDIGSGFQATIPRETPAVGREDPAGLPTSPVAPTLTVDANSIGLINSSEMPLVVELFVNDALRQQNLEAHQFLALPVEPSATIKGRVTTQGGHVEEMTFSRGRVYVVRSENNYWVFAAQ